MAASTRSKMNCSLNATLPYVKGKGIGRVSRVQQAPREKGQRTVREKSNETSRKGQGQENKKSRASGRQQNKKSRGRGRQESEKKQDVPLPEAGTSKGHRGAHTKGGLRGRGRGRGIGRGMKKAGFSAEDATRVAHLQQRRSQLMSERMSKMGVKALRHLLGQIIMREPGMVFDVMTSGSSHNPDPPPPPNLLDGWCSCGRCREMPTDIERKCCRFIEPDCLSLTPEFDLLVLEPMYLRQFNRYRGQIFGVPGNGDNKAMRHAAYTQFILLSHGKLGHGNRRVIPSCCVWQIRTTFPEPSGIYTGFVPFRLA